LPHCDRLHSAERRSSRTLAMKGVPRRGGAATTRSTPNGRQKMRLAATTRKIGFAVLAGGIGVLSLTTVLSVGSAHAATLASVSQQGGGSDQFAGRLARIDELVQSGDC